jgi:hypothetical protein
MPISRCVFLVKFFLSLYSYVGLILWDPLPAVCPVV